MKALIVLIIIIGSIFCVSCSKTEQVVKQCTNTESQMEMSGVQELLSEGFCDEGEDEDPQPMLSGNVYDSVGAAIHHACVEIKTTLGVQVAIIGSDSGGHYYFNSLSNGSYNLIVSRTGYITKSTPITVNGTPQIENVILHQ